MWYDKKEELLRKFRKICWLRFEVARDFSKEVVGWTDIHEAAAVKTHEHIVGICEENICWEGLSESGLNEEGFMEGIVHGFDMVFEVVKELGGCVEVNNG